MERAARCIVAETETEWYAEQIAHSISGGGAEVAVTWSFDLDEAVWWCGVLDPSIPEADVIDGSEDWCAEDVLLEEPSIGSDI